MALSAENRSIIERWTGPIASSDVATVEQRIDRLGGAYFAALEMLLIARAEMRLAATKVSSGDDRIDHTANLAAIDAQIAELVAAITNDPDIVPSGAAESLLDQATGASLENTTSITVDARNTRRG